MFNSFFKLARKAGKKIPWLSKSRFWTKFISPLLGKIRFSLCEYYEDPKAICFFTDNKNRIERIVSWLADEESRNTFQSIIKFRCYGKKKDFITQGINTQYFINDFFKWSENEVLIDCGAFDGDTIDKFISLHPKYSQIIAFEPDTEIYKRLYKKHRDNKKILTFNAGVSDINGKLFLNLVGSGMNTIVSKPSDNTISIPVMSIDSLDLSNVSIIKMDIEGAEMQALKGAENTILKYKPKLAICIYHSNEDMLKIAEYIHEILPEYKLYVRHHERLGNIAETVLYAQMERK